MSIRSITIGVAAAAAAVTLLNSRFDISPVYSAPPGKTTTDSSISPTNSSVHPDRDLPNFAQVAPGIYRGAAPTAAGWAKLHAMGIRTEVDLRIEKRGRKEAEEATRRYGITRVHIPLGKEAPTNKQVQTFLTTLDQAPNQPIFIHCHYGADRTGAMVGIYREVRQGWDFDRTYAEMRHYGFKPFLTELKGAVRQRAPK